MNLMSVGGWDLLKGHLWLQADWSWSELLLKKSPKLSGLNISHREQGCYIQKLNYTKKNLIIKQYAFTNNWSLLRDRSQI